MDNLTYRLAFGNSAMKVSCDHFVRSLTRVTIFSLIVLGFGVSHLNAEPLRIAYTSIAAVYGPLWLTKDAAYFKKYDIEPEFVYIAGGPPSLQALIAGGFVDSLYKKR
jgi:ABC-type nitrate/sulfonate/bicarbonate transport system substrate-binding protein